MSIQEFNHEFIEAHKNIMYASTNSELNSFHRVLTLEWMRKLYDYDNKTLENARIRNEYIQYLKIMLNFPPYSFTPPFDNHPPDSKLTPLPELLCNCIVDNVKDLPRTGPIQPIICHKSEDGKAFMTVKRCPEGGVFCYMAVTPNNFLSE